MIQKIIVWIKKNYKKALIGIAGVISLIGAILIAGKIKSGSNKKTYDKKINELKEQEKKDEKIISSSTYAGHNNDGTIK